MKSRHQTVAICALLAACALIPYARVGTLGFTSFDDPVLVTQNAHVRSGVSLEGISWAVTSTEQGGWQPLTWLTHMLDAQLFGMRATGHHLTNLLLHLFCTLLLFGVLHALTGAIGPSAMTAALFAVHPLQVESVAWIAARRELLGALFWLLAIGAYARWVKSKGWPHAVQLLCLFVLGLASQPTLVSMLPLVLLLLDFWPLARHSQPVIAGRGKRAVPAGETRRVRSLIAEKIPLFVLTAASWVIIYGVQQRDAALTPLLKLPLGIRIANALTSSGSYLRKAVWPSDLCALYPQPQTIEWTRVSAFAVVLLVITALVALSRRTRPYLAFGWIWFVVTLVPVFCFVPSGEAFADRHTYIPLIGIFVIAAWFFQDLAVKYPASRTILAVTASALVLLLGWGTWKQTGTWENSAALFGRVLEVVPDAVASGQALVASQRPEIAVSLYEAALLRDPANAAIHAKLGSLLTTQGKEQEAVGHYEAALRLAPGDPEAHNGLGDFYASGSRWDDAIKHFLKALEARPDFPEARYNLGKAYAAKGMASLAIEQLRLALEMRPDYAEAREKIAAILVGEKRYDEAAPHYLAAISTKPEDPDLRFQYARVLVQARRMEEAIAQLRESVRLRPNWPEALNNLAWFLATRESSTSADRAQSVVFAEAAVKLVSKPDPGSLDTLAVSYAAAERFDEAVKKAEEAIQLANSAGDKALASEIEGRAKLYRARKAYVER
jgi:tetratricopeptide (TPR) repeat protein